MAKPPTQTQEYDVFSDAVAPAPLAGKGASSAGGAPGFTNLVAVSASMKAAVEKLQRASLSDATILLQGETGTGKEAVAEAIHWNSPRRDRPFIVVDCGALPPQLLESELFGHERGSFTGAIAARPGAFEAAAGGTVLLDEIGELDLALQPKLLRALERKQVKRVGSNDYRRVDFRVIAATHRPLKANVERGTFRSDLYFRLAVVSVRLPPLRERLEDLPALVEHLLRDARVPLDRAALVRQPSFMRELTRYGWPGNVRELRNHIESCLAMGEALPPGSFDPEVSGVIPLGDMAVDISVPLKEARDTCVRSFEKRYLEAILRRHDDRVSAAARAAGMDRAHFYRLLWKYGLREPGNETREIVINPALAAAANLPDAGFDADD